VSFYLNGNTAAQSPTTGLPGTPVELGRVADTALTTITSGTLSQSAYDLVKGFVSDVLDPDTTTIPAGLWDFNIWAQSNANSANQTILQLLVYIYNGSSAPTLIATSDDVSIYDPSVAAQYIVSVVIPQTTILATDRIYVEVRAKSTANNRTVTIYTGDSKPSHIHSTIPSVTGTGLAKVLNSVFQSPASLLVDADVDSAAAIAQSKISGLTSSLAGKASTSTTISAGTGLTGGGDLSANRSLAVSYGTTSTTACVGNDSRLSDSRTPTAHAATHVAGGSDPITVTAAQISGTLTQNTSGTAAGLSSTLAVTSGGTGQTAYTDGQLLIGNTTTGGLSKSTLTAGSNVTITNANGAITIASTGGTSANIQVFTSSGIWTKPTGAKVCNVVCIGGGGGGGSGRKTANGIAGSGGGGGAGGGFSQRLLDAALLGSTEAVTIGAGGAGGGSISANSTNGANGVAGGTSSFGAYVFSGGGGGGGGGTTSAGTTGSIANQRTFFLGGAGGAGGQGAGSTPTNSQAGAGGGGGGGGFTTTPAGNIGGNGGTSLASFASGGGGTGGTTGSANGVAGSSVIASQPFPGGGGGGGAALTATNSGSGGAGGLYGGGGGGGGASLDGIGNSGAGGNGADGIVVVITHF
jgi:hypothetical protein